MTLQGKVDKELVVCEKLMKEASAVVDNYIDDLLFYMNEYRDDLSYDKIAGIFDTEYRIMAHKVAQEMKQADEREDIP